ncbi:putative bifunctional diguanylate cyclase/phosphodiesterase [Nitrincola alkalilacustris]|uniref:putative bifunctional diguanylate cyclase/phosphodiesterase n=1 Tax=Nitrincola alkalilacustris TaxID=1571224 RepID=UPI00124CF068|nr:bifunctional diguanylate cyclase/phosphodiesterase [Nitrincola alkalilacustris]
MLAVEQALLHPGCRLVLIDPDAMAIQRLTALLPPACNLLLFPSLDIADATLREQEPTILLLHENAIDKADQTPLDHSEQYNGIPLIVLLEQNTPERLEYLLQHPLNDYLNLDQLDAATLFRVLRYASANLRNHKALFEIQTTDPLTGTGNRQYFYSQLQSALKRLDQGFKVALFAIDIDNFSAFNNNMGHDAGDRVVLELSRRLRRCQGGSHLARIGSDEFTIILIVRPEDSLQEATQQMTEQLIEAMIPGYQIDEREATISCSIGIAQAPVHHHEFDALIRFSGLARLRAKKLRGHSYAIYDPQQDKEGGTSIALEPELWRALQQEEFRLYYQPRINLNTGDIVGAEALIRWHHPTRGLITPDTFIPVCEQSGLIVPIGYWVIQRAGKDMKLMRDAGLRGYVGVNLSFRQFQDGYLANTIERLIHKYNIDTTMLEFELTETALFSDEVHVRQCMESLSALGVEFSLDDFGTGYSSFSLLQKLPISTLKIDKSFISGIPGNKDDEEIVRTIINLAKNLQRKVIAEGVETQDQLEFLLLHGCDLAQGYLFSRPVSLEKFLAMLIPAQPEQDAMLEQ